jgi:hypothetical protein
MASPHHDRIRERAFKLWEQEGRPSGRATEQWLQAEREVGEEPVEGPVDGPVQGSVEAGGDACADTSDEVLRGDSELSVDSLIEPARQSADADS